MASSCWDRIDGGLCVSAFLSFEHLSSSGLGTEPRGSLSGDGRPKIKDVNIKRLGNVCHDHLFPAHTILMAGTEPSAPTSTLTVVCSLENPPRLYAGPEKPFTAKTFWSLVPHVMGVSSWLYSCLGSLKHSENFGSFTNLPSTSLNQLSKSTNYFVQKNSLLDQEIASG